MSKSITSFPREFQIWSYNVGHSELLLRSPKSHSCPRRIDVLFKDVRALELRSCIIIFEIEEVLPIDVANQMTKPAGVVEKGHKIYLIKSEGWTGCVVAGAMFTHEDDCEYNQPSALL